MPVMDAAIVQNISVITVNHEKKKKKRKTSTWLESLERLKQQLMHSVTQRGTHSRRRRWWDKNCLEMFRLRNKQGFHTKRTSSTLCTAWSLFPLCIISCLGSCYCAGFQPGSVNKVQLSTPTTSPPPDPKCASTSTFAIHSASVKGSYYNPALQKLNSCHLGWVIVRHSK